MFKVQFTIYFLTSKEEMLVITFILLNNLYIFSNFVQYYSSGTEEEF